MSAGITMITHVVSLSLENLSLMRQETTHGTSRFNGVWLFVTLWSTTRQAPLSMGFCSQEYCSGLPCPPSGDLSNQGSNLCLLQLLHCRQILCHWATGETHSIISVNKNKADVMREKANSLSGLRSNTFGKMSFKENKLTFKSISNKNKNKTFSD